MPRKQVIGEVWEIDKLCVAAFNPEQRTNDIGSLVKSIERMSLLQPILIDKKGNVVDGHRRLAACKELGWTEVPCIVTAGDQAETFSEVNTTNRAISGNQALCVYLKEPRALGARARSRMEECEEAVGLPTMRRMAKEGFSMATWSTARNIAEMADITDPRAVVKVLRWIMSFRCGCLINRALNNGTSPATIMAAVNKNKPIRIKYAAAE